MTLLMRYHNGLYCYPMLIAHDTPLSSSLRRELRAIAGAAPLSFAKLEPRLPPWIARHAVPDQVLGFPIEYRHMIRWKVGLLWGACARARSRPRRCRRLSQLPPAAAFAVPSFYLLPPPLPTAAAAAAAAAAVATVAAAAAAAARRHAGGAAV